MKAYPLIATLIVASSGCGSAAPTKKPPGVTDHAQMNDLSVMFPLARSQAEWESYLTPGSQGATGTLLPYSLYSAVDTNAVAYADLRLVSFRLDPCFAQIGPIDSSACEPQLRLIFQTLAFEDGAATANDDAVHAFYRLDGGQFEAALGEIIGIREANGGTAALGPLAPHPIMAQQGLDGPMATQLRATVLKYAGSATLVRFTLFRSAGLNAPAPAGASGEARFWNFHGFDVAADTATPIAIPSLPDGAVSANLPSTATEPLYASFQPETVAADDIQVLANYGLALAASAADRQGGYDAALRIENPNVHSPNTIDCVSCHMSQPARQLTAEKYFGLSAVGNANAFATDPGIPATDVVPTTAVLDGDRLNLHAFSYRGTAAMINQRVINETAAILAYVRGAKAAE